MPINNGIINQKGTPAFYSDIFANRPAFGYAGRVFISTDTGAIYEDTGTSWTLIADAGAGTTGTLQQVTTNGNTTTLGIVVQGININDGAGTGGANTALGNISLGVNTTGSSNTAVGSSALSLNTTGNSNTGIGSLSLQKNTTGISNTALGLSSLQNNTTGQINTAIGTNSLLTNTTGSYNVGVGLNSLFFNTTGQYNSAVGTYSLQENTTGANNTAVGYASMNQNTTASDNTAVGYSSLNLNTTGIQNTAIGKSALNNNLTGNYNVAVGYNSLTQNSSGSNNTAIGQSSLAANTTASFNTAIGVTSLQLNTTGASNTALGYQSLNANTTGASNTAIGVSALSGNTTASFNTAIGFDSLKLNTTGTGNTAIGYTSGNAITTGSNNTILGNYAGTSTLANNIVLSDGAGNVRLFSDANGLIGINQAVGSTIGGQLDIHTTQTYALVLNGLTTSNAYTAFSNNNVGKWRIGNTYNAGANTFDIYNLGTSSNALSINSTTNNAVFSGNVGINGSSGTNYPLEAYINSSTAYTTSSRGNILRVLNTNTTANTYAGIELSAEGTANSGVAGINAVVTGSGSAALTFYTRESNTFAEKMRITSGGNVGIGNTGASDIRLYVTGQSTTSSNYAIVAYNSGNQELLLIRNDGLYLTGTRTNSPYNYNVTFSPRSAGLDASGGLGYIVSTKESKGNIESIKNIDFVNKLNPVKFNYRKKNKDNTEFIDELHEDIYFGFIADEVEQINKDLVFYDNLQDGSKKLAGVHYNSIIAILTKSIQELNEKLVRNNIN
jgi:hypothetical protein